MKGKYRLLVSDNKVIYDLEVRRNITVITGDSGTGKTNLCSMLIEKRKVPRSFITVDCDVPVHVVSFHDVENAFLTVPESCICIIDESELEQARVSKVLGNILGKDNYFILMTRSFMPELPYSVLEIYTLVGKKVKIQNRDYVLNTLEELK